MWGCIIIWKYVVKRLLQLILILFGITLLSFALMQTASGDTVDAIQQQMGTSMSEEAKAALRHEMGLDQPFIIQYFQWVGKIFTGNMGYSYIKNQEVFPMFMQALPNTLLLTLSSIVTTILISIPLGIWSAVKQNKITDYVIRVCTFIGNAMPNFFIALLIVSFGILAALHFAITSFSLELPAGSGPPAFTAINNSLPSFVNTFPLAASALPFVNTSLKSASFPAPPEAMTGTFTNPLNRAIASQANPRFVPSWSIEVNNISPAPRSPTSSAQVYNSLSVLSLPPLLYTHHSSFSYRASIATTIHCFPK